MPELQLIQTGGVIAVLLLILYWIRTGEIVPRKNHEQICQLLKDRGDEWHKNALAAQAVIAELAEAAKISTAVAVKALAPGVEDEHR